MDAYNPNLATFVTQCIAENAKIIQSLFIHVSLDETDRKVQKAEYKEAKDEGKMGIGTQYGNSNGRVISMNLLNLAQAIKTMERLNTFSFILEPQRTEIHLAHAQLRRDDLHELLVALPMNCINIELDISEHPHTLGGHPNPFDTLRLLMPRLEILRFHPEIPTEITKSLAIDDSSGGTEYIAHKLHYVQAPQLFNRRHRRGKMNHIPVSQPPLNN